MGELGANVQDYEKASDKEGYLPKFSLHKRRISTESLTRIYIPIFIPQATTAVGTYVVGICPCDAYVVDIKHVCKTVAAAATVEVTIGSKDAIMTAQSGATTVSTAVLATDPADRKVSQSDIIKVVIATTSGDLTHLSLLITLEPVA